MSIYMLAQHDHFEMSVIGLFATKREANRKAIAMRAEEWDSAFRISRLIGRREKFEDGGAVMYGYWWDELPRKHAPLFRISQLEVQG